MEQCEAREGGQSLRDVAREIGVPRSTLQHWLERKDSIDAAPEVVAFFESPAGTAFLHRLALAAHFVITLLGAGGVRLVCYFFELSGLDVFVASSYGSLQKTSVQIEEAVVQFEREEKVRLSEGMPPREIVICQDETFHPETCLVAIEPVSNYVLLEGYAEGRKASDWTSAMEEALEGIPAKVIQSTSDEAKGILRHVQADLGARHAPDIFHVQREVFKAAGAPLARETKKAKKALEKAGEAVERHVREKAEFAASGPRPGRPPQFDRRIERGRREKEEARRALEAAESDQALLKEAVRGIADAYHPIDLETGALRDAEAAAAALKKRFSEIEDSVSRANLKESGRKGIQKAKKVLPDMAAAVLFFHSTVRAKIDALSPPPEIERAVFDHLLPGLYIEKVAGKKNRAEDRDRLLGKSREFLRPLQDEDGPFRLLRPEELGEIERVCEECAGLFQPSSSCVEGRNGHLALRRHSLHRLGQRKLKALTAVHNFHVKRKDGTTPASRFFGQKTGDLFEYLLANVDIPARPAMKRSSA